MKFFLVLIAAFAAVNAFVPKLDGRIVGGKVVSIEEYPHQVSVRYNERHICGGSILNQRTIVTAAHCVYGKDHALYSVRVGHTEHSKGHRYVVSKVIQHDQYNSINLSNDVAVLKLATPLQYSDSVRPIELPSSQVHPGNQAWVSGWGLTIEDGSLSNKLRAVDVETLSRNECNKRYNGRITKTMICAQSVGHDACQGDSGGPLVSNGKLIGVVSWGYGCARPQYPGVYANVYILKDWILSHA